jgi:hypothetical protein
MTLSASQFALDLADAAHAAGDHVSELFWLTLCLDAIEAGE